MIQLELIITQTTAFHHAQQDQTALIVQQECHIETY